MKCKEHPKYKGIHKPKVDCLDCWKIRAGRLDALIKEENKTIEEITKDMKEYVDKLKAE